MKKKEGIEFYSFSKAAWVASRGSMASWDYGRKHALPFWPEFVTRHFYHDDVFFSHDRPTSTAIELPLSGELLIEHGERVTTVRPGELYILPVGERNALRAGTSGRCWKLSAGFCGQMIAPMLISLGISGDRHLIRLSDPERVRALLEQMFRLLEAKDESTIPELAGLTVQFMTELARQQPVPLHPLLADAVRIFEMSLAYPVTLGETARELNTTERTLIRLFQDYYHMTPGAFFLELRMRKAVTLLRNSALPVEEIAQQCGYSLARSFSREFRKRFGISPLRCRKNRGEMLGKEPFRM